MRRLVRTLAEPIMAGLILVFGACGDGSGSASPGDADRPNGPIRIGVIGPLSGDVVESGTDTLNAARLAVDEINAAGGLLGEQLEIVQADDRCDEERAPRAAEKLLAAGVVGVTGGYCSAGTIPASAVLHRAGIPILTVATNPGVTERGLGTVFRPVGRDDRQARFAARFLAGPAGARKLAILHNHTVYGVGLAEHTKAVNDEAGLGMQVVFFDGIDPGSHDFTSILTTITASGADTLYFTGYPVEAGLLVRQAKDLNLPVRLVGGDATNEPAVIETAGAAAEGFIATTAPLPEFLPGALAFTNAYTERFRIPPGPFSVYQYDAVKVLADAITRASSTDSRAVLEALRATRYTGITGEIAFDGKGDRQTITYVTAIVRDGAFRPHKKLGASGNWIDG